MENRNKKIKKQVSFISFKRQIEALQALFALMKEKEEKTSMTSVDEKLVDRLLEEEEFKLAEGIKLLSSGLNSKRSTSRWVFNPLWLRPAGFLMLAIVGLSAMAVYFTGTWNLEVQTPVDRARKNTSVAPFSSERPVSATLIPQNVAESGYVSSENQFRIQFEGEIKGELKDVVSIEPKTDFDAEVTTVDGESIITITPKDKLQTDTEYSIALNSDTGIASETLTWNLKVEPKLEILSLSPSNGSVENKLDSVIEVELNRSNIDLAIFEDSVSISPPISGSWVKSSASFIYIPDVKLQPDSSYQVVIDQSLTDEHGNTLAEQFKSEFSTLSTSEEAVPIEATWSDGLNFINTDSGRLDQEITLSGDTGEIKFNLYSLSEDQLYSSLQQSLNGEDPVSSSLILVDSVTLIRDEIGSAYAYRTDGLDNGFYILEAKYNEDKNRLLKYVAVTDFRFLATVNRGRVEGWILDGDDEEYLIDTYLNGGKMSSVTLAQGDKKQFNLKLSDFYIITRKSTQTAGIFLLPSSWPVGSLIGAEVFPAVEASVSFSSDTAIPGEKLSYKGVIVSSQFPEDKIVSVVVSALTPATSWGYENTRTFSEIFSQTYNLDGGDSWFDIFTIPDGLESNYLRFDLYLNDGLVRNYIIPISAGDNRSGSDEKLSIETDKGVYAIGEVVSVAIKSSVKKAQKEAGQLRIYRSIEQPKSSGSHKGLEVYDSQELTFDSDGLMEYEFTPLGDLENEYIYSIVVTDSTNSFPITYRSVSVVTDKAGIKNALELAKISAAEDGFLAEFNYSVTDNRKNDLGILDESLIIDSVSGAVESAAVFNREFKLDFNSEKNATISGFLLFPNVYEIRSVDNEGNLSGKWQLDLVSGFDVDSAGDLFTSKFTLLSEELTLFLKGEVKADLYGVVAVYNSNNELVTSKSLLLVDPTEILVPLGKSVDTRRNLRLCLYFFSSESAVQANSSCKQVALNNLLKGIPAE